VQCEHTAEVTVVTPKKEIKDSHEDRYGLSFVSFLLILIACSLANVEKVALR
jgi:hypothetical protein